MKRLAFLVIALLAAASAPAHAQVHGTFAEARVVPLNSRLGAAYLQFDKSSASLMGQLRLSFYPHIDFGFSGGLSRIDTNNNARTSVRLGGDFRGQVAAQGDNFPVNVSLGGALGVETADDFNILSVGPLVQVSRTLDTAERWVGYGGGTLLLSRYDDGQDRHTDTSFPVRAGIEFRPNPDMRVLAEAQLALSDEVRDDFAFTLGVLFPF